MSSQTSDPDTKTHPIVRAAMFRTGALTPEEGGFAAGAAIAEHAIDDPTLEHRPSTDTDVT